MTARFPVGSASPFDLADDDAYRRWRDWKLANAPAGARISSSSCATRARRRRPAVRTR